MGEAVLLVDGQRVHVGAQAHGAAASARCRRRGRAPGRSRRWWPGRGAPRCPRLPAGAPPARRCGVPRSSVRGGVDLAPQRGHLRRPHGRCLDHRCIAAGSGGRRSAFVPGRRSGRRNPSMPTLRRSKSAAPACLRLRRWRGVRSGFGAAQRGGALPQLTFAAVATAASPLWCAATACRRSRLCICRAAARGRAQRAARIQHRLDARVLWQSARRCVAPMTPGARAGTACACRAAAAGLELPSVPPICARTIGRASRSRRSRAVTSTPAIRSLWLFRYGAGMHDEVGAVFERPRQHRRATVNPPPAAHRRRVRWRPWRRCR